MLFLFAGCDRKAETTQTQAGDSPATSHDRGTGANVSIVDAAGAGDVESVKRLLATGADVETRNASGTTPLITASVMGRTGVARVLIEADVDLEAKNAEQTTALYNAAFFCHPDTVKLLLEHKANVHTTDKNGTPLVDVMAAPWEAVAGIYQLVYSLIGVEFDAEKTKETRPVILKMLKEQIANETSALTPQRTAAEIAAIRSKLPPITDADWSMYNHDVRGWRYNSAEETISPDNAAKLVEKWRFPNSSASMTVGAIHATPTVVNGHAYFGTATHPAFYKLKPDGTPAWVYRIPENDTRHELPQGGVNRINVNDGIVASALVTETGVYVGNGAGMFFALDRITGEELWKVDTRAEGFPNHHAINIFNASAILADGKVVVGGGGYEHPYPLDPEYECCTGRGFVVAFDPDSGEVVWKYEVGEEPKEFLEPIAIEDDNGKHVFTHGPSTSSVWSTPSFDKTTGTIFFGTDVHNSPRQPTDDDPRLYSKYSAAVIAVDVRTGKEKWVTQVNAGDVFNHTMSGYDSKTGRYKDCSIGDTPKLYQIDVEGVPTSVVGVGCKNGGFYVMRADNGELVANTPVYSGKPKYPLSPSRDPRMIALPSAIGGIQTGCATDGKNVFTNAIDWLSLNTKTPGSPEAGRVVCVQSDLKNEHWRHERPRITSPLYTGGDPVAAGIAIGGGVACFAPVVSEQLVVLNAKTGDVLKQFPIGASWTGPSISRGRIYVGTGSVMFLKQQRTGALISFGLPGEDEVDRMGAGNE
ncbi:MAG: ankyrin repeat domain-containing protein [Fuerstiella sp.]